MKDTVPKEGEDDEVDGEHHATLHAPLRLDAIIHDLIPVLARQDLKDRDKHTAKHLSASSSREPQLQPGSLSPPPTQVFTDLM